VEPRKEEEEEEEDLTSIHNFCLGYIFNEHNATIRRSLEICI
jgi:hypothetical protein